ncbi:MAG: hypothetical protein LBF16_15005 [Pseudomonadales bacterium]|nr:hypothetical protein [Pseudomonadales bacterium]
MGIDFPCSDDIHLLGDSATHSPALCLPCHAVLLALAGMSPLRPLALPGTPITALASAFN